MYFHISRCFTIVHIFIVKKLTSYKINAYSVSQAELEKLNQIVWPEIGRLAHEQIQEYAKGIGYFGGVSPPFV